MSLFQAKRDNAKRTGTAGGKNVILDDVDNCILDILGNESSVVLGLCQPESDGVFSNLDATLENIEPERVRTSKKDNSRKRKLDLSERQAELKVQLLESELYKNKLQILWLEKKLEIKRSKFTMDLEENSNNKKGNGKEILTQTHVSVVSPTHSFTHSLDIIEF